jgi:hypothetical protein
MSTEGDSKQDEIVNGRFGIATIRAEGRGEGRAEGKQQTLLRQLAVKFGELPSEVHARAATASESELDFG